MTARTKHPAFVAHVHEHKPKAHPGWREWSSKFRVGGYWCEMKIRIKGERAQAATIWTPCPPTTLTDADMAQFVAGRQALCDTMASELGAPVRVVEQPR